MIAKRKNKKAIYPCLHCGTMFDFPVVFCKCCNIHNHTTMMSGNEEFCYSCREGRTPEGAKMFGPLGGHKVCSPLR